MPIARFTDLCLDANAPDRLAPFWAAVLGYEAFRRDDGLHYLRSPAGLTLWINEVPEPKTAKHRVHLDVHCTDVTDLLALGATVLREPTAEDHWWQLLDLEGGEFCAFPRDQLPAERLYEIVVDSADHVAQARWWGEVLGAEVQHNGDAWSWLEHVPGLSAECIVFGPVPEAKTVKNRVHWDVDSADLNGLLNRGATVLHEPTDAVKWHVLADPEGNEFCVFAPQGG